MEALDDEFALATSLIKAGVEAAAGSQRLLGWVRKQELEIGAKLQDLSRGGMGLA